MEVGDPNAGFPLPLVEKWAMSALHLEDRFHLLDGHNTPGFSGGPSIRCGAAKQPVVIGAVSACLAKTQEALNATDEPEPCLQLYGAVGGIVRVHDASQVQQLAADNPIATDASRG